MYFYYHSFYPSSMATITPTLQISSWRLKRFRNLNVPRIQTTGKGARTCSKPQSLKSYKRRSSISCALPTSITTLEPKNSSPMPSLSPELSQHWREIGGESNWEGLLDPIDPLLRSELIRYAEMCQAAYDSFDYDQYSKYCGSCKYTRSSFFNSLGLADFGYDVTRYLYATSNVNLPNFVKQSDANDKWSDAANWMGYVAVSNDETSSQLGRRDIAIAWRGTVTRLEWLVDVTDVLKSVVSEGIPCPDEGVEVETGFINLYTDKQRDSGDFDRYIKYSAREQVLAEMSTLVDLYTSKGETVSISVTGHSLGSALAILSAYDIAETGLNKGKNGEPVQTTVYSFSGPRVGNVSFKKRFEEDLGIKAIRVVNIHDIVPKVPGVLVNEALSPLLQKLGTLLLPKWSYTHVGVELELDHTLSPFFKDTDDISCFHNLEAHMHMLDGYHAKEKEFELAGLRDPALVNKACDFLKNELLVPPSWRQDENKGMVRSTDGKWMQPERAKMEDHHDDTAPQLEQLGLSET